MAELFNLEVEAQFIGVLARIGLSNPGKARVLLDQSLVVPDRMHDAAHRAVLEALRGLLESGQTTDSRSLWTRLKDSEPLKARGGLKTLTEILNASEGHPGALNAYSECIRELALRRKLVEMGRELAAKAADTGLKAADVIGESTRLLAGITLGKREIKTAADYLLECVDHMQAVAEGKLEPVIPTGLAQLDSVIGGLQPTLTVVGALPGVGKSALFATLTRNVAMTGRKVGVFSLEDQGRWLVWRVMSHESGVPQFVLQNRRLTNHQMERVSESFTKMGDYMRNVLIDDRSGLSPQEIVQTSRDWIVNHGVKAIFVDHAGEMRFDSRHKDRYDLELMEGLSDLREIAKRYGVPVVVAAHLKRRQGLDEGTEPTKTDFANSSAFEKMSRVALGLSRKPGSDTLRVSVLKQTNGATHFGPGGQQTNFVDLNFRGVAAMVQDCEGQQVNDLYADSAEAE